MAKVAVILKSVSRWTAFQRKALLTALGSSNGKPKANGSVRTMATPGSVKSPGVCGGDARFVRTRIPVWVVEAYRRLGACEKELLESYPTLHPSDLPQAWASVALHRREIDECIRDNEES